MSAALEVQLQVLIHVAAAMALGAIVGLERELAVKPAGLRTHMLVAGAAALLVGLTGPLVGIALDTGAGIQSDPIRVVEAIVAGISFLGAGTIIRRSTDDQVEGLTTAASLLLSGAVGISVALRQYLLAAGATLLALIVLRFVGMVEHAMRRKRRNGEQREKPAPR